MLKAKNRMAAGVGEEDGGVWGAGARNYDDQSWGVTRQGADQSGRGHHEKNNQGGIGAVVARHYDNLPEKGRESRQESRIYHMRSLFITYKGTCQKCFSGFCPLRVALFDISI